nr:MAG TPA: hypothetical protein [Caudoviricetes sp.]
MPPLLLRGGCIMVVPPDIITPIAAFLVMAIALIILCMK